MNEEHKSPEQIQHEIDATREEIGETLDALQRKVSPSAFLNEAIDYAKNSGGEIMSNLGQRIRDNPVPLALIGVGAAWLMVSGRSHSVSSESSAEHSGAGSSTAAPPGSRGGGTGYQAKTRPEQMKSGSEHAKSGSEESGVGARFQKAKSELQERVDETGEKVKSRLGAARQRARELGERARGEAVRVKAAADRVTHDHPLGLGVASFALGVATAAALPSTRREAELLAGDRQGASSGESARTPSTEGASGTKSESDTSSGTGAATRETKPFAQTGTPQAPAEKSAAAQAGMGQSGRAAGRPTSTPEAKSGDEQPAGAIDRPQTGSDAQRLKRDSA